MERCRLAPPALDPTIQAIKVWVIRWFDVHMSKRVKGALDDRAEDLRVAFCCEFKDLYDLSELHCQKIVRAASQKSDTRFDV